jgi:hypothetical protein
MNLLLNQKEIEMGVRTYMVEKYDVLMIHTRVKGFIYGDNVVSAATETLHFPDYTVNEEQIEEGIKQFLEESHGLVTGNAKVTLLPSKDLTVVEALVEDIETVDFGEEF